MNKHLSSILIALLSLFSVYVGVTDQANQSDSRPVVIEESVEADGGDLKGLPVEETEEDTELDIDIETEEVDLYTNLETETEVETDIDDKRETDIEVEIEAETEAEVETNIVTDNETESETEAESTREESIIREVVKANSNDEIKEIYNELESCDDTTIYSKVIINGKEYKDSKPEIILKDLVNKYGKNLSRLDTSPRQERPVPTKGPVETQAPSQAPVETKEPTKPNPEPTTRPSNNAQAPKSYNQNYADQVLQLVNVERVKAGLSQLTMNSTLTDAANVRGVEIVSTFSHTRPDGTSCFTVFDEFGINPGAAGENIAYGYPSAESVVEGWMNSPGHRANILNGKFNKLGVGVHKNGNTIYWTQLFTN